MSAQEYITIDDLTYRPIKNAIELITAQGGSLEEVQDIVDRANNYYEDIAQQCHVAVDDIQFPIPMLSTELLNYFVTWKYASESAGQINTDTGFNTYTQMEDDAYRYYKDHLLSMTKDYISGDATEVTRVGITFGNIVRS